MNKFGLQLIFTGIVLILGAGLLMAQTEQISESNTLSLQDCIDIALENKVDVKIAQERLRMASVQRNSALGDFLPSVSMSARGSHNVQGEGQRFFSGIDFTTPASTRDYYNAGLSVNQTLFSGGGLINNRKFTNLDYQQSMVGVESVKEQVVLMVTGAYLDVLRARELIGVYEQTLESSEGQVELVQERYNLGAVAKSDVYKAQTNAGNDRINLLQQQNIYDMRKRDLNVAMGRKSSTSVNLPEFNIGEIEMPDLEAAKSLALEANKNLKELEYEMEKSQVNVAIAKANLYPSVNASFGYDRSGFRFEEMYNDLDKNWSYNLGVGVSIPLFSRLNNRSFIQTRKAQMSIAEKNYQDARLQVEMQVENLIQQLETYKEVIRLNELNLQSAQEDLRMAKERYNIGQATLLDVLDAQAALTNAQRILVYTQFDAKIREAQLQTSLGRILQNPDLDS